jgi:hypothetical protein
MPAGSNPASGSSKMSSSGPCTSAATSCTRCWLPCESTSTLSSRRSAISSRSSHVLRRASGIVRAHAVQAPEVLDLLPDVHARVQTAFLGHVAEAAAAPVRSTGIPLHRTLPALRSRQTEDGPHRGRLAGSIGTQKADHLSGRHREGEVVEGGEISEAAGQTVQLKESTHPLTLRPCRRAGLARPCGWVSSPGSGPCRHEQSDPHGWSKAEAGASGTLSTEAAPAWRSIW